MSSGKIHIAALVLILIALANGAHGLAQCDDLKKFEPIRAQIQAMKPKLVEIVNYQLTGQGKSATHNELALLCDTFGPRMSGSKSLESAIDYMRDKMVKSGLKVTEDEVMVPNWELVSQSCEISAPVQHTMNILTLGDSVSTQGTLEAEVYLVHDFAELDTHGRAGDLKDKIVVINYKWTKYEECIKYRETGALLAAKYGAAAALIRSLTGFSIDSPHTGAGNKSIPTAAITVEDANLIERWIKRKQTVKVKLNIQTKHNPDSKSRNLIGDIPGSTQPDDIIFLSGHTDSWYNTAGAMDDGGGMMASYMALDVLSKLKLSGKRTIRAILWTAEEPGLVGAEHYFKANKDKLDNFKVVIESDAGTFTPQGWAFKNMGEMGQCVMQEILFTIGAPVSLLYVSPKFEGSDIEWFTDAGVPGLSLLNDNYRYFDFHHTSGDTMDLENPVTLDRITALFASTVYVLSNLDVDMKE